MALLRIALLPVPPKHTNSSAAQTRADRAVNDQVLQEALQVIFGFFQKPSREGINVRCADGKLRRCFPIVARWSADHPEKVNKLNPLY
jgi:hypothetical protein